VDHADPPVPGVYEMVHGQTRRAVVVDGDRGEQRRRTRHGDDRYPHCRQSRFRPGVEREADDDECVHLAAQRKALEELEPVPRGRQTAQHGVEPGLAQRLLGAGDDRE
jgi:hypothetical protein